MDRTESKESTGFGEGSEQDLSSFAEYIDEYIGNQIAFADAKAGFGFTLSAGLLAYLANAEDFRLLLLEGQPVIKALCYVTAALLTFSAAIFASIIFPRLSTLSNERIVSFIAIAKFETSDEYIDALKTVEPAEIAEEQLHHCHDIARICSRKYTLLKNGYFSLAPAVLFFFPVLFLMGEGLVKPAAQSALDCKCVIEAKGLADG